MKRKKPSQLYQTKAKITMFMRPLCFRDENKSKCALIKYNEKQFESSVFIDSSYKRILSGKHSWDSSNLLSANCLFRNIHTFVANDLVSEQHQNWQNISMCKSNKIHMGSMLLYCE